MCLYAVGARFPWRENVSTVTQKQRTIYKVPDYSAFSDVIETELQHEAYFVLEGRAVYLAHSVPCEKEPSVQCLQGYEGRLFLNG